MRVTAGRRVFLASNKVLLIILAFMCLFPIIHILAISFSNQLAVLSGKVALWPVQFTTASYRYVLYKHQFWDSIMVSFERIFLGSFINMLLTILAAYPLSKETNQFKRRIVYVWFFLISMLFSGGLIPFYMVVKSLHLIDTIWALVLPAAVPVGNIILLMNFFRNLPKELEEAAYLDGAGHWSTLLRIYVPTSKPAIATLVLFCFVAHWNEWFSGLLFMNRPEHYPLQTYLQTILINVDLTNIGSDIGKISFMKDISNRTFKAAQIFLGALPILCVYPFLQKYFTTGIVLGSVKG